MHQIVPPIMVVVFVFFSWVTQADTIMKCQDATGKWHYGDFAAEECARSRLTEIDRKSGLKVQEYEVPPTKEEVEARKSAEATRKDEEERAQEQRELEDRLLAVYDSEANIIRTRDERLASIDKMLQDNESYKSKLQDNLVRLEKLAAKESPDDKLKQDIELLKSQILEYESAVDARLRERELVVERYNKDLSRYRDIVKRRRATQ